MDINSTTVGGSAADWTQVREMASGMLEVDYTYQWPLDLKHVERIVKNFNRDLVNMLKVSYRDGHYYVFDGQHTLAAIKAKFGEDYPVLCKIYYGMTIEEEAALFAQQTGDSKQLAIAYKMRALALAGDEKVKDFLAHTEAQGFTIELGKRTGRLGGIQAVKKAYDCYKALGAESYDRMLKLINATWRAEKWSVNHYILGGLCSFLKTFGEEVDDKVFINQLSKVGERDIVKAAARFPEESPAVAYASAMVNFYNYKLRGRRLRRSKLIMEDD